MAHRHLMAVCVVCLLCAEHLPCKEHVSAPANNALDGSQRLSPSDGVGMFSKPAESIYDKRKDKTKENYKVLIRGKRHAGHEHSEKHHHTETPEATKVYIQKLFAHFSNNDTKTMNIDEFGKMMEQLNLTNMLSDSKAASGSTTCMEKEEFLGKMTGQSKNAHDDEDHHGHDHNDKDHHDGDHDHHHASFRDKIKIESEHMLSMCPILLYHIINRDSQSCLNSSAFTSEMTISTDILEIEPRSLVWLYSTLSIIGVSLCGLLGVAVIPIMEKHFYHHVLQFLVALAVGTLAGDALLHLLPHAMMPTYEGQNLHQTMMFRGLAAVGGIVFFYFFERFLTMVTEWRQRKQKRDKPTSRVRVLRDPESVSLNNGTATCKHKYSSYPYCYDEIAMETKDDHHEHQHVEGAILNNHVDKLKIIEEYPEEKKANGTLCEGIDGDNNTLSTSVDEGSIESNALCNNNKHAVVPAIVPSGKKEDVQEESYTIILR